MKKYLCLALSIAFSLTVLPLCMYNSSVDAEETVSVAGLSSSGSENTTSQTESEILETDKEKEETTQSELTDEETICIYLSDEKKPLTLSLRDYIVGVVAAEMPAAYEDEALKAQAVASLTFARRKMQTVTDTSELDGAVITTNSKKDQGYMSVEKMKERWGDDFDIYYEKIKSAVNEVFSYAIAYEDELIIAAFHAISTGVTENAENVWEEQIPYLVSVESEGDKLSANYESTLSLSGEELEKYLYDACGFVATGEESEWLGECEYTEAGTLSSIRICDDYFTGSRLREILSLRSSAIEVEYSDGKFVFTVRGYGHGVGLSQYGADYYARQGYTWQEIIKHYYPDTEIVEV